MKLYFHNLKTFIEHGLTEWTTWIGIGMLIFGSIYYKEINQLIHNILLSPALVDRAIDGIASAAAFGFILYKQKK